jgi:hypothetical protein
LAWHRPLLFHRLLPLTLCPLHGLSEGITAATPALARKAAALDDNPCEHGTILASPIDKLIY